MHVKDHQKVSNETTELSSVTPKSEGLVDSLDDKLNSAVKEAMDKAAPYASMALAGKGAGMLIKGLLEGDNDIGDGKPIDMDDGLGR